MSQFCIMNDIMNNIVNDKKGHNIVNDKIFSSFAHKPDGLLVFEGITNNHTKMYLGNQRKCYVVPMHCCDFYEQILKCRC